MRITETQLSNVCKPVLLKAWTRLLEKNKKKIKKLLLQRGWNILDIRAYYESYGLKI